MFELRFNRLSFWALIVPTYALLAGLGFLGFRFSAGWIPIAFFCVARLHDLGRSGKWVLAPLILQFVATFVVLRYVPEHQLSTAFFAIEAATLLAIVWLGSEPGEPVSNAWGGPTAPGVSFGRPAETGGQHRFTDRR